MQPILSVRNLSTGYGKKQVLFDVSLDVMPGEILLITGGNGSGKSTLLKAIYGLLAPWNDDAEITFRPDPNGPALNTRPAHLNLSKGLDSLLAEKRRPQRPQCHFRGKLQTVCITPKFSFQLGFS